jgi:uncharacterized membrane protein
MPVTLQEPKAAPPSAAFLSDKTSLWLAALIVGGWSWAAFARGRHLSVLLQVLAFVLGVGISVVVREALRRKLRAHFGLSHRKSDTALKVASLACLLFVLFLPEYLLGRPVPLIRSGIFLLAFGLLFKCLGSLSVQRDPPLSANDDSPRQWLLGFCVAYFGLTTTFTLWKLHVFGYVGQDIAYFTQCLYTTLHGHLFYSNMYHDLFYSRAVTTDFAAHNQPVLFLFLPFYVLFKSPATLLVFRNLFVVLCAWPLYLILRRFLSSGNAAWGTAAFLIAPAIIYQNLYDFAPLSVVGFPLLFAFYYYLEGRIAPFIVWLVATQLIREDLVFVSLGFAGLALLQKRKWSWVMLPGGLGVFWAWLSWMVIFPHFLHGATSVVNSCFAQLGNGPKEIGYTVVRHPRIILTRENLTYVKQVIGPLGGVLYLGSPAWLMAVPYVVINMMGQGGACNTAMIYRHYALIPYVLLFVSFVLTTDWLSRRFELRRNQGEAIASGLIACALTTSFLMLVFVTGQDYFDTLRSQPWHSEARQVAAMLPANAAVAVPRYMLPMVAARAQLYQSLRLLEYAHPDPDYIVVDKDWPRMAATSHWRPNYDRLRENLANNPSFSVSYESPNYVVYRKCAGCEPRLPLVKAETSD